MLKLKIESLVSNDLNNLQIRKKKIEKKDIENIRRLIIYNL